MRGHGEFSLDREGDLLVFRVKGALNLQTVQQSVAAFEATVEELQGASWCCLNDIRQWELFPPECIELAQELNRWCHQHGLTHEAVVVPHSLLENISKKARLDNHQVITRYFDSEIKARQWLAEANSACSDQTEYCTAGG